MIINDFEFDGIKLSSFKGAIGYTNLSGDNYTVIGGNRSFVTFQPVLSSYLIKAHTQFETPYSFEIEVLKQDCDNQDDVYFSEIETRQIIRWVSKNNGYAKLQAYADNTPVDYYFMAYINLSRIIVNARTAGFKFSVMCDSPWAYRDKSSILNFKEPSLGDYLVDTSDEQGNSDINISFTFANDADTFILSNKQLGDELHITAPKANETITINSKAQTIISSLLNSNIENRFNWHFPSITNNNIAGINYTKNDFSSNIPCQIQCSWKERVKGGWISWID